MPEPAITYDVTFRDFQFLQSYMARRIFARNRRRHLLALLGVVLCAIFLAMAIVINAEPYRAGHFAGIDYPSSFYLLLILYLLGAILSLMPAVRMRLRTLRLQVSDDGPLLGATKLSIEEDGLRVVKPAVTSKYSWAAFQGVEMAKDAVVLPVDNGIGLIVPGKAFATDAERYAFAADIAKRVEAAKRAP